MSKKLDEKLNENDVLVVEQVSEPVGEQSAKPIDVNNIDKKSGSVVLTMEEYMATLTVEQKQLAKETRVGGFPDLFEIRGLENDKESTQPALVMSRPVKIFTALYEANYKRLIDQSKKKVIN